MLNNLTLNQESYEPYILIVPKPNTDDDFTIFQQTVYGGNFQAYILKNDRSSDWIYLTDLHGDYSLVNLKYSRYDN